MSCKGDQKILLQKGDFKWEHQYIIMPFIIFKETEQ